MAWLTMPSILVLEEDRKQLLEEVEVQQMRGIGIGRYGQLLSVDFLTLCAYSLKRGEPRKVKSTVRNLPIEIR